MSDTSYATFQHYGTAAQRAAFVPAPGGGQPIYIWRESDTGNTYIYDTGWHLVGGTVLVGTVNGRLTTETGVPVSTSDRTAQGTLYFTPYNGNQIALYDGAAWQLVTFSELSLALTLTSGKNYDVFIDYNAGTPQIVLSAAWTTDTARADAITLQDGVYVKSGATDHRLVGTIRASAANVTEDSLAKRFVWNLYNQVERVLRNTTETTNSWNYTTATFRQANANAANQFEYVCGLAATLITAIANALLTNSTNTGIGCTPGIGVDSTSVNSAQFIGANTSTTILQTPKATYKGYPGLGYHTIVWLEYSVATGTTVWYGDGGVPTLYQSGIEGTIWN